MNLEAAGLQNIKMFFTDTYALIEIIRGNEHYKNYLTKKIVVTKLNLMELYYALLRDHDKETAEYYYNFFIPFCINIEDNFIKAAMHFKLKHKKRKLSYVDCIGYIIAWHKEIKFLTGDKEFKNMENVEFVK